MPIVIGLLVGTTLGLLAGSAAVKYTAPTVITVPANKSPALAIPPDRVLNI